MPDHRTHKYVGVGTGVLFSLHDTGEQDLMAIFVEAAGGAAAGWLGGLLPDLLEPALSSWHRKAGHSCAAATAILSARDLLTRWTSHCRAKANQCREARATLAIGSAEAVALERLLLFLAELFWRFLAGFLNGLAGGYVSHLALDAMTPRCIPLITGG